MRISSRSRTAPFIAMDVLAEAQAIEAAGGDVIHMEVGEPAYGASNAVRMAVAAALLRGDTLGYTGGLGTPALREAIAALYKRRNGIDLDPGRVVVTSGSSGAFLLSFLALFDTGERVAIADPGTSDPPHGDRSEDQQATNRSDIHAATPENQTRTSQRQDDIDGFPSDLYRRSIRNSTPTRAWATATSVLAVAGRAPILVAVDAGGVAVLARCPHRQGVASAERATRAKLGVEGRGRLGKYGALTELASVSPNLPWVLDEIKQRKGRSETRRSKEAEVSNRLVPCR